MSSKEGSTARPYAAFTLALILIAGAGVRLHGITREAVWWDEFTSLMHIHPPVAWEQSPDYPRWNQVVIRETAPSLFAFWKNNRQLDPATMPLYYTFEYAWNRYVSRSIPAMRVLSILIGVLIIPVVYLLGRDLFGKNAGLIAALCLALSPIHRQFAQEIRMYGMMTLLSALSAYSFFHVLRGDGRRWWVLHAVVNLGLFWTHPFAILLPAVEGAFWLMFHPGQYRRLACWIAMNAVIALPSAIYMATIRFWSQGTTGDWMRLPTLIEFASDLFADDCIGLTYQLRQTPALWSHVVSMDAAKAIVGARFLIGRWAVVFFLLCTIWLCAYGIWRARKANATRDWPWNWSFFLAFWWLLPPIALYLLSVLYRPCIMPRYTLPSSLGLYLILGGAIAAVRWRVLRAAFVGLLVLFYGYQQSIILGEPQHTDWKASSEYVRAAAQPKDVVLVHNWLWKRVFAYNLGPVPNVISYSKTFDVLAELAAFSLSLPRENPAWAYLIVQTDYFESGGCRALESELAARGLSYELHEFGGMQHVLVYRVARMSAAPSAVLPPLSEDAPVEFSDLSLEFWRVQDFDSAIAAAKRAAEINPKYPRAYSYLGMALKEKGDTPAAIDAFRQAVALNPFDYPWSVVNLGQLLTDSGRFDEAVETLNTALSVLPNDSWAHACLGYALLGKGDVDSAVAMFRKAVELDPADARPKKGLDEALARAGAPK